MRQKSWVLKSHKALVDNETLSHSTLFQLSTDKLCRTGKLTHPIFKKKKKAFTGWSTMIWVGCFAFRNEKFSVCYEMIGNHFYSIWLCHLQEGKPFRNTCIKEKYYNSAEGNKITLKSRGKLTCSFILHNKISNLKSFPIGFDAHQLCANVALRASLSVMLGSMWNTAANILFSLMAQLEDMKTTVVKVIKC